ncbi:AraC family transcriptional regulator [Clostridium hydrogenum]|uniref:AraC family transcriptional regulator n=1 Tax=Clostridium hydrogenum TaxID=2855764 RepID=UPI001F1BA079|nr:AraC family transcriptional regulator [Clostridium hydrogenum]
MEYIYENVVNDEKIPFKIILHNYDIESILIRSHWHEELELTYVIAKNEGTLYIDGQKYIMKQKDIFLINSNCIHSISVNSCIHQLAVTFLIPCKFLESISPNLCNIEFDCMPFVSINNAYKKEGLKKLRKNIMQIVKCYDEKDTFWNVKITGLCYETVYLLLKYFKKERTLADIVNKKENLKVISEIVSYIKNNYTQPLPIEQIADKFGFSPQYLCRYFKKHMGTTILKYINNVRLINAHRELMNTNKSIITISLENGFANEKSFINVFKSVYNRTPFEYRNSILRS